MNRGRTHLWHTLAVLGLAIAFWAGTPVSAQNQNMSPQVDNDTRNFQVADMDRFLDSHPEVADQLRKDPSLIRSTEFLENHPQLRDFLQQHPGIREEFSENPNAFMRQEERFERREDDGRFGDNDITRRELSSTDQFLDSHPEIAEQLRKDPSLINNREFVEKHPDLRAFLENHPGVREEVRENPNAFFRAGRRFDRREDAEENGRFGDRDITRRELASMNQFLDSHPEIAEQLRKDPSLIKNREFVEKHPDLRAFLQNHPGVREEFRENPEGFMQSERRFDQHEDFGNRGFGGGRDFRDPDTTRGELVSFGTFLNGHAGLSQQLTKDPTLVNNKEFLTNHPELQEFMKAHPQMSEELKENPKAFMSSLQQVNNNNKTTAKPMVQSKHKP